MANGGLQTNAEVADGLPSQQLVSKERLNRGRQGSDEGCQEEVGLADRIVVAAECGGVRVVWSGMNMRGFA